MLGGDGEVTLLYGNRTSGSVMFAEELADLKNRYGPRLQLVHVLSREPRDVELFSGRLDADRLRRLLTVLAPAATVRPRLALRSARDAATTRRRCSPSSAYPASGCTSSCSTSTRRHPSCTGPGPWSTGETTEVTVVLDGLTTTAAAAPGADASSTGPRRCAPTCPFACKGGVCGTCRARVTEGEVDMRRNYALEPAEVEAGFVLTCQSYPSATPVTVDFDA